MTIPSKRLWIILFLAMVISPFAAAIYCDEEDCYDLLGLSQNANSSEIKKAYYRLSLKYHPDKNPDPESKKLFVKIANAYEILKDDETRQQYDYALEHPEEVFYNTARYYSAYYGHKTDTRAVIMGLLVVVSAFQYLNQWTRYTQAIDKVKKTPAYRNKLKALEMERLGGMIHKKKSKRQMDKKMEEELSKELDLRICGADEPSLWGLVGVRLILLPYMLFKLVVWRVVWWWRYDVRKAAYTWEDACYLTQKSLRVWPAEWSSTDESKKLVVGRRLWEKPNLETYLRERRRSR